VTSRRLLSVRVTLLAVALAAGAYAAALPVYLFFRVSRPALALGAATEAITTVSAVFARRDSALNRAVAIVRDVTRRPRPSVDSLTLVHHLAALGRTPLQVSAGTAIPPELGTALASIDGALSRVGNVLEESAAPLESGRQADAAARPLTVAQLFRAALQRGHGGRRPARATLPAP